MRLGAEFDRHADGSLMLTREGGHHANRIVHAGGDATGAEVQRALHEAVNKDPWIRIVEHALVLDLLRDADGRACGMTLHVLGEGSEDGVGAILARAVVLATGGMGQVYASTTNPVVSTGDGVALALRAGAVVTDIEFVQFHPTALMVPAGPDGERSAQQPLVSEAMRGEGAHLVDADGKRFMVGQHELAELAPRDIVAKGIHRVLLADRHRPRLPRRPAHPGSGHPVPDHHRVVPGGRHRPDRRPDPGRAGRALRQRRRAHRPVRPHLDPRPVRLRRGRLHRRPRRQPARVATRCWRVWSSPAGSPRTSPRDLPPQQRPGRPTTGRRGRWTPRSAHRCSGR